MHSLKCQRNFVEYYMIQSPFSYCNQLSYTVVVVLFDTLSLLLWLLTWEYYRQLANNSRKSLYFEIYNAYNLYRIQVIYMESPMIILYTSLQVFGGEFVLLIHLQPEEYYHRKGKCVLNKSSEWMDIRQGKFIQIVHSEQLIVICSCLLA